MINYVILSNWKCDKNSRTKNHIHRQAQYKLVRWKISDLIILFLFYENKCMLDLPANCIDA